MVYNLMNLETPEKAPQTWEAFWDEVDDILDMVRCDFAKDIQTYEEAIEDAPARTKKGVLKLRQRDHLIRYRKSNDADQLADLHRFGQDALQRVEEFVEAREWTPAFAHHWTVLMFTHGFIMPSAFATESDLQNERAGVASRAKNSREPHLRWFSHYCLRAYDRHRNQGVAEGEVEELVRAILASKVAGLGRFKPDWFKFLVSYPKKKPGDKAEPVPSLTYLYRSKNLSLRRMRELAQLPTDDLPPLNLSIPHPRGGGEIGERN